MVMFKFPKAVKGERTYIAEGTVWIDGEAVESIEEVFTTNPSGVRYPGYVLVTMKTGVQHKVYEFLRTVAFELGFTDERS